MKEGRSSNQAIRVYRFNRWPLRIIVICMIVGGAVLTAIRPQAGIGVLSVFAVGGALMEFCYERAAAYVTAEGARVVPRLGRTHTYPWSRISGFSTTHFAASGGKAFVVNMYVNDCKRPVMLSTTIQRQRRRGMAEQAAQDLNSDLRHQHDRGVRA
jgi:hypothetical protein